MDDNEYSEASLVHLLQAVVEHGNLHQLDVRGIALQSAVSCPAPCSTLLLCPVAALIPARMQRSTDG